MRAGFDIDGTIFLHPGYFAELSRQIYIGGGSVVVISSRMDTEENRLFTERQLREWSIRYEKLFLFKPFEEVEYLCPHSELDWYQQYLWQKVHHAKNENLDVFYDDDDHIINLFMDYASEIKIYDVKETGIGSNTNHLGS